MSNVKHKAGRWTTSIICSIMIAAALCLAWWMSVMWHRGMNSFDAALQNPAASAEERAALLSRPVYLDGDSYMWIIHAKEARDAGVWRLRYTYADNAPFGREMHWSQSIIWLTRLVSNFLPHANPELRLEWAATWVNTLLQIIFIGTAALLVWRSMGPWPAAFTPFLLIGMSDLNAAFHPFRLDHQTLYCFFSMLAVMCPVCALSRRADSITPSNRAGAVWFAAGGCAMGLLFWVGATVGTIVLGVVTIGWLATVLLLPRQVRRGQLGAEWRTFGLAAAVMSLMMYLIEYAPNHLGWRLEVNHPLYSFALAAHGEILRRVTRWLSGDWKLSHKEVISTGALIAVLVSPAAVAAIAGTSVYLLHDDATRRMHRFITEFQPYFAGAAWEQVIGILFKTTAMMPMLALLALIYSVLARDARAVSLIWLALMSLVFWLITLWQMRWADMASLFAVLAVVSAFGSFQARELSRGTAFRISAAIAGILVLQAYTLLFYRYVGPRDMVRHAGVDRRLIKFFLEKRFAIDFLKALRSDDERPVMTIPDLAPAIRFFSGIDSVGSLYWRNVEGVQDVVRFFNDQTATAGEALEIARERGLAWVILPPAPPFAEHFWIIQHDTLDPEKARQTLLGKMIMNPDDAPNWLVRDRLLSEVANPPYSLGPHTLRNTYQVWRLDVDR